MFGRSLDSVKRAIVNGELPKSIRLFGASGWYKEVLDVHFRRRHEAAEKSTVPSPWAKKRAPLVNESGKGP